MATETEKVVSDSIDLSGFLRITGPFRFKGVYLLYRGGEVVYIGRTRNVIKRLTSHKGNSAMLPLDQAKFIPEPNAKKRANLEAKLIRYFSPVLNKRKSALKKTYLAPQQVVSL